MRSRMVARIAEEVHLCEIGSRSPYQTVRLSTEDVIILLGAEVVSLARMTPSMMLWSLWHSETKRHIDHGLVFDRLIGSQKCPRSTSYSWNESKHASMRPTSHKGPM